MTDGQCSTLSVLKAALIGCHDPAFIVDETGLIVYQSPSAGKLLLETNTTRIQQLVRCDSVQELESQTQADLVQDNGETVVPTPIRVNPVTMEDTTQIQQQYWVVHISFRNGMALKQDVVDAAFDPMFEVDQCGTILLANEAATRLFGYTKTEFLHQNISLLCGGQHAAQHQQYMQRYLETGIKHVIGKQRQVMARKKDGTEIPVELGIQEIVHGQRSFFCGFVKDLTTIQQHEAELEQRESLLQAMINSSFDPMFEIDEMGVIRIVNRAAVNLFGYTEEEFIGNNISMICGSEHAANHDAYLQRYLVTGQRHIIGRKRQVKAKRKDGTEFDIELGVQEVVLDSGRRAFCGFVRDLTQQKLDKRALQRNKRLISDKFFGTDE